MLDSQCQASKNEDFFHFDYFPYEPKHFQCVTCEKLENSKGLKMIQGDIPPHGDEKQGSWVLGVLAAAGLGTCPPRQRVGGTPAGVRARWGHRLPVPAQEHGAAPGAPGDQLVLPTRLRRGGEPGPPRGGRGLSQGSVWL